MSNMVTPPVTQPPSPSQTSAFRFQPKITFGADLLCSTGEECSSVGCIATPNGYEQGGKASSPSSQNRRFCRRSRRNGPPACYRTGSTSDGSMILEPGYPLRCFGNGSAVKLRASARRAGSLALKPPADGSISLAIRSIASLPKASAGRWLGISFTTATFSAMRILE
jgi:hypothetical protein